MYVLVYWASSLLLQFYKDTQESEQSPDKEEKMERTPSPTDSTAEPLADTAVKTEESNPGKSM